MHLNLAQFDAYLFTCINASPHAAGWLLAAAAAIAEYLIYGVPALLLALWFSGRGALRVAALKSALAAGAGLLVNQGIALAWARPRPFAEGIGHAFLQHAADGSFPSDHVTVLAAVGFALCSTRSPVARRIGVLITLTALAVGLARVFLGVHYPGDVLGAFAVAALAVAATIAYAGQSAIARIVRILETIHSRVFSVPIRRGWIRP